MKLDYRQVTIVSSVVVGLIVLGIGLAQGNLGPAITFLLIMCSILALLLWFTRPSQHPTHITHSAALAAANDGDVILYWQPG